MSNEELRPCPFCGEEHLLMDGIKGASDKRIHCPSCHTYADWYKDEETARKKWNERDYFPLRGSLKKKRRDMFSAAAMQGMLSSCSDPNSDWPQNVRTAELAVSYADALIAKLDKEKNVTQGSRANAALISAAPELLECVKGIVECNERGDRLVGETELIGMANRALAKAEGK
jgi:hypothetical protein